MIIYEQTEKSETGLDVVIKAHYGGIIAWTYSEEMAAAICDSLNNFSRKIGGEPCCSGCHPIQPNASRSASADPETPNP